MKPTTKITMWLVLTASVFAADYGFVKIDVPNAASTTARLWDSTSTNKASARVQGRAE